MERIYTITDAKRITEKRIEYYTCRIEAWKKVERLYKKDGNPFSVLSKNFNNLTLRNSYGSNEAAVYFKDENGAYADDYINLEANSYTHEEKATTPDAIEKKINALIAHYTANKTVAERATQLIVEQLESLTPFLDELKKAIKDADETNTGYTMKSYIKEYLRIL